MAKKKGNEVKECYISPMFKQGNEEWYNQEVKLAQEQIEGVVQKIYNGNFPTKEKYERKIHCFTGCTPIYLGDKNEEDHLNEIRASIERIFMAGRMFGHWENSFKNKDNQE